MWQAWCYQQWSVSIRPGGIRCGLFRFGRRDVEDQVQYVCVRVGNGRDGGYWWDGTRWVSVRQEWCAMIRFVQTRWGGIWQA